MFSSTKNLKYKSTGKAKLLSTVLPGTGQIYAGDWRDGLNSFVINSLAGSLFILDIIKNNYSDAILTCFFVFRPFYSGNRYNAENEVKSYNRKLNKEFAKGILQNILIMDKSLLN